VQPGDLDSAEARRSRRRNAVVLCPWEDGLQLALLGGFALVAEPVGQLPEHDHTDEDEPDDEHREHNAPAFGGGIRKERQGSDHGATLPHVQVVRDTCALDRVVSSRRPRDLLER